MTEQVERIKLKNFGLLMGGVFSLVTGAMVHKGNPKLAVAAGVCAAIFLLVALTSPMRLKEVYRRWMKFAEIIGAFNAKLILGFIYVVIFTPVHLYLSVAGKDPLKRKFDPDLASYWEDRVPAEGDETKYDKQY